MIQDTLQRQRGNGATTITTVELANEQTQALGEVLNLLDQPASRKAIGLFGPRGSGKTTLLIELARDGVRGPRTPQHRKVVVATINAANLPRDLAPWQRLIFATLDKLAQQPGASSTINDLHAELQELVQHEQNNDESATLAAAAFAHHFRAAFAGLVHSAITLSNATFVVAIDHLDKTTSENAAQLLEATKYFLNAQNCSTLICADEAALLALLGEDGRAMLYKWMSARVDVHPFALPAASAPSQSATPRVDALRAAAPPRPIASDIPQPSVQIMTEALGSDRYAIERAGDYWRAAMRSLAKRNADGHHTNVNGQTIAKLCALRLLSPALFDAARFDAPLLTTLERRARSASLSDTKDEWVETMARDARLVALFKTAPSFIGVETRDLATALRLVQTGDAEATPTASAATSARNTAHVIGASAAVPTNASVTTADAAKTIASPQPRRQAQPATVSVPAAVWTIVSVAAGAFIVDRLVKLFAQTNAAAPGSLIRLEPASVQNLLNNGLAIGAELIGLALCVLIVAFWGRQHKSGAYSAAFGLIIGGLAANLFDRIAYGSVMNMLHVGNLPVFNLAHVALLAGALLLAFAILTGKAGREQPAT
jgi:lipoprotein signal peptidase